LNEYAFRLNLNLCADGFPWCNEKALDIDNNGRAIRKFLLSKFIISEC
jgi:hypothetical protein